MNTWMESMEKDITEIKNAHAQIMKELPQLKADQADMHDAIENLKVKNLLHDKEISTINETLNDIKEDTKWIKRKIAQAIISAVTTGIVTAFIALALGRIL
ncbi:septal ring factor EnvC (AmiA/AmiB activator) [Virgibacillus halotolerans]|uniref:hemolysin XhlA family protein n=1 Tax=Virgibacillus halotolerans TaxID=1071053 RepID=UPI0019616180|nr:hemolysin XhlA family protein [Virgibacillus halotolerans]MBM7600084.1 septal ring factor EnvC (AmiA/AmiB activator) [Virgibacillus halotolerans]